jgi:hypothetical protein
MATPFFRQLSKLARSPQGRKVVDEAKRLARDPATRKRIEDARRRVMQRGRAG